MSEYISPSSITNATASPPVGYRWDDICEYDSLANSGLHPNSDETVQFDECKRFLDALAPTGIVTFQTLPLNPRFRDKPGSAFSLNRTLHGGINRDGGTLARLNKKGACVFAMVSEGDGKGRSGDNVRSIRAIFVDLDGSPLAPVLAAPVPPSITVESSPGRFHAYWLVRDMPVKDFKPAQQALAARFHADPSVCDPPRLMRLPGFIHRKGSAPFRSRLLSCEPSRIYAWQDLAIELELPISLKLPERIQEGSRNATLFKLAVSSSKLGIPKSSRLQSLLTLNAERCVPPLPESEVREIVENAYQYLPGGSLKVPIALLADQRFVGMSGGAKLLLLLSYQRLTKSNNGDIALLWKDFKHHFQREKTFGKLRAEIVTAGLLSVSRAPTPPRGIEKAKPGLYKFALLTGE